MKAVLLTAAGGPEVLRLADFPLPALTPTDIQIRLKAAGINPVDYKLRQRGGFQPDKLPTILGCDGAGVVEAIGESVDRFRVGDEVYFFNGGIGTPVLGNYATHALVHQDYVALKSPQLSMHEAAALPLVWITAWEALVDRVQLQAGQTILIHAGAGGVGHVAIQLAKHLGAQVITTVSNQEKIDFVKALGADHWINYTETDFVQATLDLTANQGVDVVFDTVGGNTCCQSFAATKLYGKIVTLLEEPCDANAVKLAKLRNLSISYELMLTPLLLNQHEMRIAQRCMLEEATRLIAAQKLQIKVAQTFPLSQAAEAHRLIETGHVLGKLVLTIA